MLLSQFVPPSPSPTASSSPVSTSVYLFMPCKLFHQCHCSRFHISSVQSLSHVWFFATPWTAVRQASPSITNSWSLLKLISIESVMPSNHRILCHPLLLLPSICPSIRVSSESVLHIRWPNYWSFSFSISPSNEYSGLISFTIDWFDRSPCSPRDSQELSPTPQFKSINSLALSFMVQLSHPYMTTGKTITLTRWTFVSKVMSLLFRMLSRFVIAFLPRIKCLLISWLQSHTAMILESKKIQSVAVSIVSPSICHEIVRGSTLIETAHPGQAP